MSRRVPNLSSGSRLGPPEALPGARPPGAQLTQNHTFASLPKADCTAAQNGGSARVLPELSLSLSVTPSADSGRLTQCSVAGRDALAPGSTSPLKATAAAMAGSHLAWHALYAAMCRRSLVPIRSECFSLSHKRIPTKTISTQVPAGFA